MQVQIKWNLWVRLFVFTLSSSSIAGLVLHFYNVVSLHFFVPIVTCPAFLILTILAVRLDGRGSGQFRQALRIGAVSGFAASVAYDIFRIPFVLMHVMGVQSPLALPLFKVFPRFGALILGQELEQTYYSLATQAVGWAYHFSNGIGFGIMYFALVGTPFNKSWTWAILFALVLEMAMLFMPYPQLFSIRLTPEFIILTILAHLVFGVVLGLTTRIILSNAKAGRFSIRI